MRPRAYSGVRRRGLSWQAHIDITRQIVAETKAIIAARTEPEAYVPCAACGGEAGFMGTLGTLDWYLCRACGLEVPNEL